MPRIYAILLAAGRGTRFGEDKVTKSLGGKPIWKWAYDTLAQHPQVEDVIVVHGDHNQDSFLDVRHVLGGESRAASVAAGFQSLPPHATHALIHDAARPFLTATLIDAIVKEIGSADGIAPAVRVTDTVRQTPSLSVIDREHLVAMQTPQLVDVNKYRTALKANGTFTDDLEVLQTAGMTVTTVPGSDDNFKITTAADWVRAEAVLRISAASPVFQTPEVRTGLGYDVHRFSTDPERPMWLGGILFDGQIGLEGHSDADVILHALVDAILGAAALGDIGCHFPPSDPKWHNAASIQFLQFAVDQIRDRGWQVVHLDMAVIAEQPKIMPQADAIRAHIATAIGVTLDRVSIKATTNEGMGFVGRREGIACHAVATLSRFG